MNPGRHEPQPRWPCPADGCNRTHQIRDTSEVPGLDIADVERLVARSRREVEPREMDDAGASRLVATKRLYEEPLEVLWAAEVNHPPVVALAREGRTRSGPEASFPLRHE